MPRSPQTQRPAISRPAPPAVSNDSEPVEPITGPEDADPVTTAALEVLGLSALPSDRRQLNALVAPRDPSQWTWEKTHAWRHLREVLSTSGRDVRTGEKPASP
jgi:hypothetical protein